MGKRAEAGIGSLILFIALVLVAATAAAVFIQTSTALQGKALLTASGSQKQVASRVFILSAWGENATVLSNIGDLYMKVKLAPGSDAISINNSYVGVSTSTARRTYRFNQTSGCSATNLSVGSNSAKFLITPRIGYTKAGYLQDGDMIDVCVRMPNNLSGDETLTASFAPPGGLPTSFSVVTPSVMTDAKIPLYP